MQSVTGTLNLTGVRETEQRVPMNGAAFAACVTDTPYSAQVHATFMQSCEGTRGRASA